MLIKCLISHQLWDVYNEGKCLRTYMGHTKAVRDVTFSNDGRRFLSAGYDRQMKLWDTETGPSLLEGHAFLFADTADAGQCIKAFSNGKTPFCIRFHPDDDKQHLFLAGMQDKKIIQYDINSSEITQEYDQHLGAVYAHPFLVATAVPVLTQNERDAATPSLSLIRIGAS